LTKLGEIEDLDLLPNTYPVGKVRPEGLTAPANRCGSSDPLVGGLLEEDTDQGLGGFGS
jgi:hypothetical protein